MKKILNYRPAPDKMTLASFLLCILPGVIGLLSAYHFKSGSLALLAGGIATPILYITTKIIVENRYNRKHSTGIEVVN